MIRVLLIGRPNVGKSALFNRLVGSRRALVHHVPGTTRDVNYHTISHGKKNFIITDTAGWSEDDSIFSVDLRRHLVRALNGADLVLLIVDGKTGLQPIDQEVATMLRQQGKKTILVVNKIDNAQEQIKGAEFYALGVEPLIMISAIHGINITELLEAMDDLTTDNTETAPPSDAINLILVGKPNVGKSSLMNRLSGQERSLVNERPGTTREALDTELTHDGQSFVVIDTPGMHRQHKFTDDMTYLSSLSTHHALERADVAVLVIDVSQGIGETEASIAQMILENHCACLMAVNKWDLPEDREEALHNIKKQMEQKLQFLSWSKLLLVSAKSGQRVERILDETKMVYQEYSRRVPQEDLNEVLVQAEHLRP
ncbi:MAG: ribosome biogenesis GTPase Der, partial [Endomicrobiales bacterium]